MQRIPISDEAFARAERAAAAYGLTVPDYLETLIVHDAEDFGGEAVTLTPGQIASVCRGRADVKAGRVYTPSQVREHLEERHREWLRTHEN